MKEMIKTIQICSNCKKQVPNECDGILYFIEEWGEAHKMCKGGMGKNYKIKNRVKYYHFVRGFGEAWDTPLFKSKEQ